MTGPALLVALAVGVPFALLLAAAAFPRLRRAMGACLPVAPLPALAAAVAGTDSATGGTLVAWGNASFALRFWVDPPGAMLLGAAALLWIAAGVHAAWYLRRQDRAGAFVVCWLMTLTGCVGVFLAADLVGFYWLLAMLSVGASGLVLQGSDMECGPDAGLGTGLETGLATRVGTGTANGSDSSLPGAPAGRPDSLADEASASAPAGTVAPGWGATGAGAVYLGVALLAEAILLPALILLALTAPGSSLLSGDAAAALPDSPVRDATIVLLLVGLGMKCGLLPCHFWMPLAYGAASAPAAAVMSGAVVKAALLALIRFLPLDAGLPEFGLPLAAVGLAGAFYGVAAGIMQSRAKHVLAYSSVSQMGFMAAVLGMGMAAGEAGAGMATAFYATHHLLVKGGLFLAVGVVGLTGRARLRWTLVPIAIIALGLGGLPLTGGALAKYAAKDLLGGGLAGTLATLSSVASTVLMLHFLRRLCRETSADPQSRAPLPVACAWLAMAAASLTAPWALYLALPDALVPGAVSVAALGDALWPVLLGVAIAAALHAVAHRLPSIPPGDIVAALAGAVARRRIADALGAGILATDAFARRWTVGALAFVAATLLFLFALAQGG